MEIVNFFEKLAGRWFSQRTTHYLSGQQSKAGKSDLEIEWLPATDSSVQSLCTEYGHSSDQALGGLKVMQKSTIEGDPNQHNQTTLLIPLKPIQVKSANEGPLASSTTEASSESAMQGSLLQKASKPQSKLLVGQYQLENDILIVSMLLGKRVMEERWWFITDNLRMRTSILTEQGDRQLASFWSEIRLGGSRPPAAS